MPNWDPDIYDRFKTHRDRPALDLLLQIPTDLNPREIWDLGCGTGELAAVLAARHPQARVHGLDSSADMLRRARARKSDVDWVQADFTAFDPQIAPDLIFTNAALQWSLDHASLIPRLASRLAEAGVFACQMPFAHDAEWQVILREIAGESFWAERLKDVRGAGLVASAEHYYDWLAPLCDQIDVWTTTYVHVLNGNDPVVEWMRGAGLRPYLDALTETAERAAFVDAFRLRVGSVLPARADGTTLFPFSRLFILARR
jgi:trans-aconitate 2-methyltransferase